MLVNCPVCTHRRLLYLKGLSICMSVRLLVRQTGASVCLTRVFPSDGLGVFVFLSARRCLRVPVWAGCFCCSAGEPCVCLLYFVVSDAGCCLSPACSCRMPKDLSFREQECLLVRLLFFFYVIQSPTNQPKGFCDSNQCYSINITWTSFNANVN